MSADLHLTDEQLLRYSRHIMLPQLDAAGQLAICQGRVLILGLGGLGSPVAMYLAAAGVGHLVLVDDDDVDISNLQRQVIHSEGRLGVNKAESAAEQLKALNAQLSVEVWRNRLSEAELAAAIEHVDVVVDCTDNFASRTLTNRLCVHARTPLVSGAAIRLEAQLTVFDAREESSPCYQCLYDLMGEDNLSCSESGVFSPLVGVLGSYQALETLKLLSGMGRSLVGRVQLFDAFSAQWREFRLRKDPACAVCAANS